MIVSWRSVKVCWRTKGILIWTETHIVSWSVSVWILRDLIKVAIVILYVLRIAPHRLCVNHEIEASCSHWSQLTHDNVFSDTCEGVIFRIYSSFQQNLNCFLKRAFSDGT